jgi:hypothetical protein
MSSTSAAFGLRPAFHPSGLDRAQALTNGIASGYASNIAKRSTSFSTKLLTVTLLPLQLVPHGLALLRE